MATKPTITRAPDRVRFGKRYAYTIQYNGRSMQALTLAQAKSKAAWLKTQADLEDRPKPF